MTLTLPNAEKVVDSLNVHCVNGWPSNSLVYSPRPDRPADAVFLCTAPKLNHIREMIR
jgi:hypothetical protein